MFRNKPFLLLLISAPFYYGAHAAENTHVAAQCQKYVTQGRYKEAAQACQLAAPHSSLAQALLGDLFLHGKGVPASTSKARNFYSKAAAKGETHAQVNLGKLYCKRKSLKPDYVKAIQFFSLAANYNNPEAQFLLALCHANGLGTYRDPSQALYWYHQAVRNGLAHAKPIADDSGFEKTNKNSDILGTKEFKLAIKSAQGPDYFKDKNVNLSWLVLAADKGHPEAQYQLGLSYLYGAIASPDEALALEWLETAANNHHLLASNYLAWMTMLGIGTIEDPTTAVKWFQHAYNHVKH